jgi:hypothetical protein
MRFDPGSGAAVSNSSFDEVLGLWVFGFIANDIKTAFD